MTQAEQGKKLKFPEHKVSSNKKWWKKLPHNNKKKELPVAPQAHIFPEELSVGDIDYVFDFVQDMWMKDELSELFKEEEPRMEWWKIITTEMTQAE